MSFDWPAYLERTFPGLALDDGLFYRWPIGIRFALGGRGPESEVMAQVHKRAANLYEGIFDDSDNCVIVSQDWPDEVLVPHQQLFQFAHSYLIGLRNDTQSIEVEGRNDLDEIARYTLSWIEQPSRSFKYEAIFAAIGNADHAIEPCLSGRQYFVNRQSNVILHMYDDRGLDIIAAQRETLVPLYRSFNAWILDYDRERINRTFEPPPQ